MTNSKLLTLGLALVAICIAGQAYSLYKIHQLEALVSSSPMQGISAAAAGPAVPIVTPPSFTIYGSIESLSGSGFTLMTTAGNSTVTADSSTRISSGIAKSSDVYSADLAKYTQQLHELQKDPAVNAQKIADLAFPSGVDETPISLSGLKAGDVVSVQCDGQPSSDNACQALHIVHSVSPAPTQ